VLVELYSEKETLVQVLEASKENVDAKIGEKENEINKSINDDWGQTNSRISEE
jgi:hypothetical protein